ncbi:DUF441 family protein [Thermohalobacter berrensis]|uniref:UPF0756 membrane protein BET03_11965 n=1 Tax=Thermohalobacter berrensis TaxID=99594 RepID=A0A419T2W1_9FIRM|nr:DUF441 family protein [Thermohalobacter berrensis]RKD31791.1 hypothetical protein BET03_11965 [Thermohalobacter berrensis]
MEESLIILFIILGLGLFAQNQSLAIASSLLILLKLLNLNFLFPKLEAYGLRIGIIILTTGILTPIAMGKYSIKDVLESIKSPIGLTALISGIIIIYFSGKGFKLLTLEPKVVIPIVFGSIIGLILFKGVPIGPLAAAGISVVIYNLLGFIYKFF